MSGHSADAKAIHCMDQLNIDMRPHIARQITAEMIKKSDLILVMSNNQKKHLEQTWSFAKGRSLVWGIGKIKMCPILINMIKLFLMKLVATFKNTFLTGNPIFNF